MLILGIDTATSVCSLALYDGSKVLAEWTVDNGFTHSEKMMPQLEMMLDNSSIDKKQLEGIAVSIGPGSFTGLRIGLSSAKAMAYALQIPICGVSTLQALAFNLPVPGLLLSPLIDGQKGNVYQAIYKWQNNELVEVREIQHLPYAQALAFLQETGRQSFILGEEIEGVDGQLPVNASRAPANVCMPHAASVAMLGYQKFAKGENDDIFTLEPYYMKKSEAEILWEKKNKTI